MRLSRLVWACPHRTGPRHVAKASVSFGHSHTCLGGERVSGRNRCTGLGRGSSHSRTKSPSSRLEAWCLARSTSWWLGKRVGLSKSSREDGRRRAGGWQSQILSQSKEGR
eukprot:scaffold223_cov396-Pavlova_lutheri.AAC.1